MKHEAIGARPVRVSIPASVAADIGGLKKAFGSILDKLGCQACCSGHDIYLDLQRDFVLSRDLKDKARPTMMRASVKPTKFRAASTVSVGLNPKVANNIDDVYLALDRIAELTGHPACATGCDILMQMERTLVLDADFAIEEQVMRLG